MLSKSRLFTALTLAAFTGLAVTSCAPGDSQDGELKIYATTGYLADLVHNLAPEAAVTTMVGPGGDPHTYQPSTRDIQTIQSSDLVLWNGLVLEAQMLDLLNGLGEKQLAVGEQIDESKLLPWEDGHYDPHIWNSTEIWSEVVQNVADKLVEVDPENTDKYRENASNYLKQIEQLGKQAVAALEAKDSRPRILITGHDAFNYFGAAYDFEVRATDFVSSEATLSPAELSELAGLIANNKIPVIFYDNLANPQAIQSLKEAVAALGWEVTISDKELYADSLGADPGVDTYLGVFEHNYKAIAEALLN